MNDDKSKVHDYSDSDNYNKKSAVITALLKWLECEFFGFFIFLSMFGLSYMLGDKGNIIFGIIGVVCYVCVMADFGIKEGTKARIKSVVRGDSSTSRHFGLLLGIVSMLPSLVTYLLLILSYFNIIGNVLMPFKLLNSGLWGIINIFAKGSDISNASAAILWVYPITCLIYPITTYISFKLGYENDDLKTKIMYKNQ